MARAYPSSPPQDYGQEPAGEWQSLRGELVALLDQVESQVARQQDPGYQGISERMRDLRYQVTEAEPDMRHREALRSVKRAVDRFNERDEYVPRQEAQAANPRDTLQSAIQQIRSRQAEMAGQQAARAVAPQPATAPAARGLDAPRFDELAHAVGGISGRLERLESELRGSTRIQTGNVKEIAEQVAQLSHVVELLAGAVGETGQVKRLEGQIAGLAKLVAQGPQVDLTSLTKRLDDMSSTFGKLMAQQSSEAVGQRLDDVSATMGRLADLQVQFANRVDSGSGFKDGIHAIEESVRNVYDRIDAIEKHTAMAPAELERLTTGLARVTAALSQPVQPEGMVELVALVESLDQRVASIQSPSGDVGDLKLDMAALRAAVVEAMEPRFAALETQIDALNDRMGEQPGDISVGQLEAQVRQLVARMDQTGEQLTGLARLYSTPVEREPAPDFEALAEMVATRASEAMTQVAAPVVALPGLSDADIDEIEKRVSRLMQSEKPGRDVTGIETSIREVNDRLARLESSLTARAKEEERLAALPPEPMPVLTSYAGSFAPEPMTEDPIAPLLDEAAASAMDEAQRPSSRRDAMPANPAVETPLRDRPFGDDMGALKAALEAKNGPRKHHPGLTYEPLPGQGETFEAPASAVPGRPDFDPASIALPPRPTSTFEMGDRESFDKTEAAPAAPAPEVVASAPVDTSPSANTFIAAARRAAQRQQLTTTAPSGGSGSLIARAFANFQSGAKAAPAKPAPAAKPVAAPAKPEPKADKAAEKLAAKAAKLAEKEAKAAAQEAAKAVAIAAKPDKKRGIGRLLAGDKQPRTAWTAEDEQTAVAAPAAEPAGPATIAPVTLHADGRAETAEKQSFLTRYRRPILLAAAIVAIAFLTLNLINQRLGQAQRVTAPAATNQVSQLSPDAAPAPSVAPIAEVPATISGPRVIPMIDSLATTASIDPGAAQGFTKSADVPAMPKAFTAIEAVAPSPLPPALDTTPTASLTPLAGDVAPLEVQEIASPVQVEMPPESIGPQELRAAAANGDARAQFEIAAIYTEGRAVTEDLAAAAVWYERASAQGFAPAQYRLANLYENGRGVEQDLEQARLWYQRAAEAGNRMAMHNLAALYASGQLGKQEFGAAAEWFEQAAARGMRDSQFNLGMLYARGLGVTQSFEDSYRWFSIAAAKGDTDAAKARDDVARSLDAEAVSRLDHELATYKPAAIDFVANFAPIGTWNATFDPGQTISDRKVITSVQLALTALGYDVGTPDGVAGQRTAEAIKAFERSTGMSESGAINPRLLAVLGSQPV